VLNIKPSKKIGIWKGSGLAIQFFLIQITIYFVYMCVCVCILIEFSLSNQLNLM